MPAAACSHCGSTDKIRAFTFEEGRGLLHIAYLPAGTGESGVYFKRLCGDCWPRWLLWKARLGFDIHTHAATEACQAECLAHGNGRYAQHIGNLALANLDSPTSHEQRFWLTKGIDGLPGVNGAAQLSAFRALSNTLLPLRSSTLYESLRDPDELVQLMQLKASLSGAGVPEYGLTNFHLVVEVFASAHQSVDGRLTAPVAGEPSLGLHAVFLTGYSDSGKILHFVNSWGPHWGDHGHGTVSIEYVRTYFHEAWAVLMSRYGPTPHKFRTLTGLRFEENAKRWAAINATTTAKVHRRRGEKWRGVFWEVVSPSLHRPVECLEIWNGIGVRLGWVFVYHLAEHSEIRELFVWPSQRRMAVGSWLEGWATDRAREWDSRQIRLFLNEADGVVGPVRQAARRFGTARGYEWRWRTATGPRLAATGSKKL